ncbi:MAG: hypothetical protein LBG15_15485 [Dysgonamonadaceae bacterium]|jgi:rubrerythrin|nr:hypothetical protein [Dysgonamonadaceae bacterium]
MIQEAIRQELIKLKNLTNTEKLKSFVFFNVSDENEVKIREIVSEEFKEIEDVLKNQRKEEIEHLLKQMDWVGDNYRNLLERYGDINLSHDIYGWANDAYSGEYNRLTSMPTSLKALTDVLDLRIFNLNKFFEDKKQFDMMNDTMNFANLWRYHHDENFKKYYKRTEEEILYDNLRDSVYGIYSVKYLYCHGIDLKHGLYDFEDLFRNIFKWDHLRWSVFCLDMSKSDFENQTGEFLQTELYHNRLLIDVSGIKL